MTAQTIEIPAPPVSLTGDLTVPGSPAGLVVFAHGSGSSRLSTRTRQVATALNERHLATLLFDLLTPGEESDRSNVFDIELLAGRLLAATRRVAGDPACSGLPLGYFGASTGAAAALCAAAELGDRIGAVVSRGGRPDMARRCLPEVAAPTLLIVGGNDRAVLELNQTAARALRSPGEIAVIPGATHLFGEPGALDEVSRLAGDWLSRYLAGPDRPRSQ